MVHKKYTYKNGKKYGPYLYENKRVGEKVVTTYVGKNEGDSKIKHYFIFSLLAIILVAGIFFLINYGSPTGNAILDVSSSYKYGSILDGTLKLSLKEGELIPADTRVTISNGGQSHSFLLRELVSEQTSNGAFYVENSDIANSGEGYGLPGTNVFSPELSFKLLIQTNPDVGETGSSSGSGSGSSSSSETETPVVETPVVDTPVDNTNQEAESNSGSETQESSSQQTPTSSDSSTSGSSQPSDSTAPSSQGSSSQSSSSESNSGSSSSSGSISSDSSSSSSSESSSSGSSSGDSSSSSSSSSSGSSDSSSSSSDSGSSSSDSGSSGGSAGITGNVVSEDEYEVNGKVSYGDDFTYNLDNDQNAYLIPGSVSFNGSSLADSYVDLDISNGVATVSTDYHSENSGFGREFLKDEVALVLNVDLSRFGINLTDAKLDIDVSYEESSILSMSESINVESEEQSSQGSSGEVVANETEMEDINQTILNETNVTIPALNDTNVTIPVLNNSNVTLTNETNVTIPTLNETNVTIPILNETNVTLIENQTLNITVNDSIIFQINEFPLIRIAQNSSVVINLDNYFEGALSYSVQISSIIGSVNGSYLNLTSPEGFTGSSNGVIIASNENESISSNIIVLVSRGAVNIQTLRSKIVVGQPVQWIKNVTLDEVENITITLPKEAKNVSVLKVEERRQPAVTEINGLTGGVLTGNIIAEVEVRNYNDHPIRKLFRKLLSTFTGNVIDSELADLDSINESVEIVLADNVTNYIVEYYTEAPQINESSISGGKRVVVSGPDELNYTDVIASTYLDNQIPSDFINNFKIYWYNYDLSEYIEIKKIASVNNITLIDDSLSLSSNLELTESDLIENTNQTDSIDNSSILNETELNSSSSLFSITGNVVSGEVVQDSNLTIESSQSELNIFGVEGIDYILQEIPYDFYDLDNDGSYDYVEWVVPHLSSQTFNLILTEFDSSLSNVSLYGGYALLSYNRTGSPYSNLTLYLPLDSRNSTHSPDLSGLENNLELNNGAGERIVPGLYGNAYQGNGTVSGEVPYKSVLASQSITVSFWIKPDFTDSNVKGVLRGPGGSGYQQSWRCANQYGSMYCVVWNSTGQGAGGDPDGVTAGQWYYAAFTYDRATQNFTQYKNGVPTHTGILGGGIYYPDTRELKVSACDGCNDFNGSIDDVMIFNSSLTSQQILDIYTNQSARFIKNGLAEGKSFNITSGDSTLNLTVDNFYRYGNTNISARIGSWDASKGYNDTSLGLVAYYHFDRNFTDSSSFNNHGSCTGSACPSNTSGIYNNSFNFDGNDYLSVTGSSSLNVVNALTISAWINPSTVSANQIFLAKRDASVVNYQFASVTDGSIQLCSPLCQYSNPGALTAGVWQLVTVTYNLSHKYFYVNGALAGTQVDSSALTTVPDALTIGQTLGSYYFTGSMDEVMIFNRSLTQSEIKSLYIKGRANWEFSGYKNLTQFNETRAITLFDISNSTTNIFPIFNLVSNNSFSSPFLSSNNLNTINFRFSEGSIVGPLISFINPTPSNGSSVSNRFTVNISSTVESGADHYSVLDFDEDILLWLRADNVNGSGHPLDISAYKNNGTLTNGAVINESGKFGKSFTLDGVNDHVAIPYTPTLAPVTDQFTVSLWFNADNLGTNSRLISKTETGGYQLSIRENSACPSNTLCMTLYNGTGYYAASRAITDFSTGQWYHIVGTYNGTQMSLYSNGVLIGSNTVVRGKIRYSSSNTLCIGNEPGASTCSAGTHFDGSIDEVMIFNRSLTQLEISSLYNSTAANYRNTFSNLAPNIYSITGSAVDTFGNLKQTETRYINAGIISSCGNITSSGNYQLSNDINIDLGRYNPVCINISVSNVNIDCKGFALGNGTSLFAYNAFRYIEIDPLNGLGTGNISVQNCVFTGLSSFGAYQYYSVYSGPTGYGPVNNLTFINNTEQGILRGMYFSSLSNSTFYKNNASIDIDLFGSFGNNTFLNNDGHIEIANGWNKILNGTSTIELARGAYNLIANNTISAGSGPGIYIEINAQNNTLINNVVTGRNYGLSISTATIGNIISNNSFNDNVEAGIFLLNTGTRNIGIINNITLSNNRYGIYIANELNSSSFTNIYISNSSRNALHLSGTKIYNNNFTNISISDTNAGYYDIYLASSGMDGLRFTDTLIGNYSILGNPGSKLIFSRTGIGEINFLQGINGSGTNLSADIILRNNFSYIDGSKSGLNKSANVSLYNLATNFNSPTILKDGVPCISPSCIALTSLNAGNVVFNVTGWSNYTISNDIDYPSLSIVTLSNITYNSSTLDLNYTFTEANPSVCWYSLNSGGNASYSTCGTNFTGLSLPQGSNTLRAYINDTAGKINSTAVTFFVDSLNPTIAYVSPTPLFTSGTNSSSIYANISSNDTNQNFVVNIFDNSLITWLRADDVNATGHPISVSSTGINGALVNGALINDSGKFGKSFSFDGSDDFIRLSDIPNGQTYTISSWFKTTQNAPNDDAAVRIVTLNRIASGTKIAVGIRNGGKGWAMWRNSADSAWVSLTSTSNYNDGNWHHITFTTTGSNFSLYVDGNLVDLTTSNLITAKYAFDAIGTGASPPGAQFQGSIDEVMIFNRSLTSREVRSLYNASTTKYQENFTGLSDGLHTLQGYVVDLAGNIIRTDQHNITVDTIVPQVSFESPTLQSGIVQYPNNNNFTVNLSFSDSNDIYGFNDLNRGLVSWLRADDVNATGHPKDISGYGNNVVLVGGALINDSGKFGKSFSFDGNGDYINTGLSRSSLVNLSACAWYRFDGSTSQIYTSIFGGSSANFFVGKHSGNTNIGVQDGGYNGAVATGTNAWDGNWHSICYIRAGTNGSIYLDGTIRGSGTFTGGTGPIYIGHEVESNGYYFNGSIDEVMIFNRTLSPVEIAALYNSTAQNFLVNYTNLPSGNNTIRGYVVDKGGNINFTEERIIKVDAIPAVSNVTLSSSFFTNKSGENLTVTFNQSDADDGFVTNITDWRVNGNSMAVLNLPLNTNSSLNDVRDYSTFQNNGSLTNGPIWSSEGAVGGAYDFDGIDDYLVVLDSTSLRSATFSLSMWVKTGETNCNGNNNWRSLIRKGSSLSSSTSGFDVVWEQGNYPQFDVGNGASTYRLSGASYPAAVGVWTHYVFVYDNSTFTSAIYRNGNFGTSRTVTGGISTSTAHLNIARGSSAVSCPSGNGYFNGSIDEVLFFNSSLSADQIKEIYQSGLNNLSVQRIVSSELLAGQNWTVAVTPNDAWVDGDTVLSNGIYLTTATTTNCTLGGCFYIRNATGYNKTIIDSAGNLDTTGVVTQSSVGSPNGRDFIIRNTAGSTVAWVDDADGNIRLAGTVTQNQGTECSPPGSSFIIKNTTGNCVAYFDSSGNLWLKGGVNENALI